MDMTSIYNFLPLEGKLNVTNLITLFHYKYPRNYVFEGESHDFWEFVYVDQGTLEITADTKHILLNAGEVIFHKPNEFHALSTHGGHSASAIICSFTCNGFAMDFFKNKVFNLYEQERQCLFSMMYIKSQLFFNDSIPFKTIPKPKEKIPFMYTQFVKNSIELFLLNILIRNKFDLNKISVPTEENTENTINLLTQKVIEYLNQNIYEKVSLNGIATALGYSVPHIKAQFHRDMNQGIMDYYLKLKIDESKKLILQGNKTFAQIAEDLNFTDSSYFCRKFKQYEGISPSEFKRTCLIGIQ